MVHEKMSRWVCNECLNRKRNAEIAWPKVCKVLNWYPTLTSRMPIQLPTTVKIHDTRSTFMSSSTTTMCALMLSVGSIILLVSHRAGLLVKTTSTITTTRGTGSTRSTLPYSSKLNPLFSMAASGAMILTEISDTTSKNTRNSRLSRCSRM